MSEDDILMNIKKILVEDDTGVDSLFTGDKALDMKSLLKQDSNKKEQEINNKIINPTNKQNQKVENNLQKENNKKTYIEKDIVKSNSLFEDELIKSRKNLELIKKRRLERKSILNTKQMTFL